MKKILLGSTIATIIITSAQAADQPVKAQAVDYVKVCNLYGAGFYYIPGTDTCIKIGGFVRAQYYYNTVQGFPQSPALAFSRATDRYGTFARGALSADVRSQTEYGTLRSYMRYGQNWQTTGNATGGAPGGYFERAYIQFAGFTFGRAASHFDFYDGGHYTFMPLGLDSSVSWTNGINIAAYTAHFGNGWSASISAEDNGQRAAGVYELSANGTPLFGAAGTPYAFTGITPTDMMGTEAPDIIANMRIDQTWGSAQIMGAMHQIGGRYYGSNVGINGHADDEWGWAAGAGLTLTMPWNPLDTFSVQGAYTEGAIKYAANGMNMIAVSRSGGIAFGPYTDAVYVNGSSLEKTQAWSVVAAFEHYWTPSIRQSFVGGYLDVKYNENATSMFLANCAIAIGGGFNAFTNCSPDWKMWRAGTRLLWNPVANLDVGVEVFYNKLETAFAGQFTTTANPTAGLSAGRITATDQDFWTAVFRVQRNFWP